MAATGSVVLVIDPRVLPLARRLQQEIESLGLTVTIAEEASATSRRSVTGAAPFAEIRLAPLGGSDVDMTLVDGATGKTVHYKLISTSGENDVASELVATRTVELLRASLLKLAASHVDASPVAPPRSEAPEPQATPFPPQKWTFAGGAAPLFSRPFDRGLQLYLSATWLPTRHFGVAMTALPPVLPLSVDDSRGSIDLFAQLYRLGGTIALGGDESLLSVRASFGVELDVLHFSGHAAPGFTDVAETHLSVAPFLGGAVRLRLAPALHVFSELAGALSIPKTTVRSAGTELGDFGRPLATLALGLEMTWQTGAR